MKISVIVPVYNVEKYLSKCLNSLVNQTLEDIEILVVNDGSTDHSQEIINLYAQQHSTIKSFFKENGGLGDARNYGLERALGEYIAFVDSDDYVTENMFEEMYNLATDHDAEIALCNLQKVNEAGEITQKLSSIPNISGSIKLKENFSVFGDISYFACNKIFKRVLFDEKRFQKGMHFEDIELIPQLVLKSKTLAFTQKFHYQYFERSDSITKTHNTRGLDVYRAIENVEKSFLESEYKDNTDELKNFYIFQGVYSFLAYLAFVKDKEIYKNLYSKYRLFLETKQISRSNILNYKRFEENYILSLPLKKKIYYLLVFFKQNWIINKLL